MGQALRLNQTIYEIPFLGAPTSSRHSLPLAVGEKRIAKGDCFPKQRPRFLPVVIALSMLVCTCFQFNVSGKSDSNNSTAKLIGSQSAMAQEEPDSAADSDDLAPQPKGEGGQSRETSTESAKPENLKPPRPQLIDTSIEEKPAVSQPPPPDDKSDQYKEREAKLVEPLKKLIQAPFLFNNSKGGSSELTDAFVAAAKLGPKLKDDLQFIIENGSPAGKLYAACLIRTFDPPAGTRLLSGFKADKTMINNKSYTSQEHYTVGEVVTDLLSPAPTILLKPR